MIGRELEQQFNIPQQYRSRYDKMFSDFISKSDITPREYIQEDVNAYAIILDGFSKGLRRTQIILLLDKAVTEGYCKRYTGEPGQPETENTEKPKIKTPTEKKQNQNFVILKMAEELGALRELTRIMNESISDLEVEMSQLKNEIKTLKGQKVTKAKKTTAAKVTQTPKN